MATAKRPASIDLPCKSQVVFSPIPDMASTPGGQSLGQRSLGVESSTSGYSVSSASKLLKGGIERDVIIDDQLCQIPISLDDRQCGIGKFRPKCIQGCANIKLFVIFMCMLITMSGTLSTGYLNSVITTIEKRFEIGSSISGLIAASYEFGSLVAVIFISYFGGRRHIPRWIGKGVVLMGFGALLFALPHIIAKKYTVHQGIISNSTDENICKIVGSKRSDENCIDKNAGNLTYVLILITAQILIGTGGTPIFTLGTTYIDNHVPKDKAPAYLAFTYATGALGPVVGYALGALLLQFYVDVFSYKVDLSPAHPRWIGAWWGGFIICGVVLFCIAVPFLMFPQVLVGEKRKVLESKAREDLLSPSTTDSQTNSEDYGKDAKDIPKSILSLLKNKIYLVTSFGICCEISIVSGFVVFLPKYIETQFGTSKSEASLFTGGIAIPGAVFGVLMGGFLLKRFQMGPKGAIQLTILLDLLALIGCGFFFFLGCENLKIAGATFPYFNRYICSAVVGFGGALNLFCTHGFGFVAELNEKKTSITKGRCPFFLQYEKPVLLDIRFSSSVIQRTEQKPVLFCSVLGE
ncbi:solute carrier organic anion transporter family member 5A1-like [Mercenaria mercenaria]|uniref:solute carrier organic anion transporter family member 5A1-like n=1 Tax=Mercenaria mercenaria TaxID=6596 RepID=UPI00234EDCB6|nr:solute carrier organic anion transporter family member 5A1-like [Mercenaria mercenaria]